MRAGGLIVTPSSVPRASGVPQFDTVDCRYLGVLLMGALVIIPAVSAKGIAHSLHQMLMLSIAVAVLATLVGTVLASQLHLDSRPVVMLVAAAVFLLALCLPRGTAAASIDIESS